jgi:predicted amidohydrolase YtcJ
MKLRTVVLVALCNSIPLMVCAAQSQPKNPRADLILIHGNIYTGLVSTSSFHESERVQAVAVRGDRIEATGTDDEILRLKGPDTKIIDLGGHFLMPGFNDAHLHLFSAGLEKLSLDLKGVKSLDEFRDRLRQRVQKTPEGEWIVGGGWDETLWPMKELPSRMDLDEITTDHPIYLERVDGHIAVANSMAFELAGITAATQDPSGGQFDRELSGSPSGIVRETACALIKNVIPPTTPQQRRAALELALQDLAEGGITSAQDYSPGDSQPWENFQVFEALEQEGKLTVRISEWIPFDLPLDELQKYRSLHSSSDPMLHTGMLKAFMDGSLGSHTAAMLQPYSDEPGKSGLPRYEQAKLTEMTKERLDAGFQIGFHAIGDKGVQMALDAFTAAEKDAIAKNVKAADGGSDYRLRIEHAQVTNPAQVAQFKQLKVIASMQPSHLLTDMHWAMARLGEQRAAYSYAWAEFLHAGVPLAFGTDYPVEPVAPFRGLYAAITRKSEDGQSDYFPDQKLTIDQAIASYTKGAAFAEFEEKEKGTLAPGMLADFVELDRDITAIPAKEILGTKVLRTIVGGKIIYEAK